MKKSFFVAVFFLLAVAALIFFINSKKPAPVTDSTATENLPANKIGGAATPATNPSPGAATILSPAIGGTTNPPPPENPADRTGQFTPATGTVADLPAATVLQNVHRAIRQYGAMFGGDPVGLNSEITAALAGQNPKHINFIDPAAGMRVNAGGELVDAWNTPYFFHQLSGTEMEIHSAGPDKIMWTADDLIAK